MKGHEHERCETDAESIQDLVGPWLLDIVDVHRLIIPFLYLFSTEDKYLQTIQRSPKKIESKWNKEHSNEICERLIDPFLCVNSQKVPIVSIQLRFMLQSMPSKVPRGHLGYDMD